MEIIDLIKEFIRPELLILIPVLYLVGFAIKKSKVKDELIPLILGMVGIVLSALYVGAISEFSGVRSVFMYLFVSITQGILVAGASVYANQLVKQLTK